MMSIKNQREKNYMGFIIYKLTNPKGGIYIGATSNLRNRLKTYSGGGIRAIKNQTNLYSSIKKWGMENHKVEILYRHPSNEPLNHALLNIKEQQFIIREYLRNREKLLNIVIKGVEKGWHKNLTLSI
jgi:hypothetical protein